MATTKITKDYVEGVNNGWKYLKWKSGKVEAWYGYTGSSVTFDVWNGVVRYKDATITIPSGIFPGRPSYVIASSPSNQHWVVSANTTSATAISIRFGTVASSAVTPYAMLYVVYSN